MVSFETCRDCNASVNNPKRARETSFSSFPVQALLCRGVDLLNELAFPGSPGTTLCPAVLYVSVFTSSERRQRTFDAALPALCQLTSTRTTSGHTCTAFHRASLPRWGLPYRQRWIQR